MTARKRRRTPSRAAGAKRRTLATEIVEGNQALARGEWDRARTRFEEALRIEETPQALEGLGMAAWWLDDDATVFDARERSYRLYRRRGDRRGAGRVAMTLAEDYFQFRGETAVARGWHQRAHRLLEGLPPIPEQGWLRLWEGNLGLMVGQDPAHVRKLGVEAAAIGRDLGEIDLEMTALALEGLALVVEGDPSAGLPRLDEATTAAMSGEMTDPVAIGLSCCFLVTACERIRDFTRAAQWCQRVREFCERTGFRFLLGVCRTQYAGVLAWRGAWTEAEEELQAVVRQFGAKRPAMQQEALVRLADLRRQQGRFEEAASFLEQVDEAHPLSVLGRAALALDRCDIASASHLAERFLRQVPKSNRTDRIAALDVLLRAQLARGQRKQSRATLEQLRTIASQVATPPIEASALLGEGLTAASDGDYRRARTAFEDALDRLARSGASMELARCRVELGRILFALGQLETGRTELQEAVRAFERLGAERHVELTQALLREHEAKAAPDRVDSQGVLTPRQVDVLRLVAHGLSNSQIAKRLVVSEFTIKRHVANLLAKLELPTRAAAAAYAARKGLT